MAKPTRKSDHHEMKQNGKELPSHGEEGLPLPSKIAAKVAREPDPMEADEPESNETRGAR